MTAKQYRKAFKRGDLGVTPKQTGKWSKKFKRMVRKQAVKQGLIPPPRKVGRVSARAGGYKFADWGDMWGGFLNALDCVAPGAESSCKKDIDEVKALEKPSKVVIGCGGMAVMAFYSGGTSMAATAALSGALGCSWGFAVNNW